MRTNALQNEFNVLAKLFGEAESQKGLRRRFQQLTNDQVSQETFADNSTRQDKRSFKRTSQTETRWVYKGDHESSVAFKHLEPTL
jgi:hypothetical protein